MRYFIYLIIAMLPACVLAQNSVDFVLGAGLSTGYAGGAQMRPSGAALGANGTLKTMWNARKWQFGAGVDVGIMSPGSVEREAIVIIEHNNDVTRVDEIWSEDSHFATPYYAPHVLVNYKLNVGELLYFYGGGVLGYTFTRQGFDMKPDRANTYYRNVRGLMTGANLGLVIQLGDRLSLDLSENWRMSFLKEPDPAGYIALAKAKRTGAANHLEYFDDASLVTEYNLHIFLTNIGLRFRF